MLNDKAFEQWCLRLGLQTWQKQLLPRYEPLCQNGLALSSLRAIVMNCPSCEIRACVHS
jgi:hypothetical protein